MTEEQKAAYINAQVACAMIEAMSMQAANAMFPLTPQFKPADFQKLADQYGIHHNAVISFFHGY